MGKYTGIVEKLPRFVNTDLKFQQKVDGTRQDIVTNASQRGQDITVAQIAKWVLAQRTRKEEIEEHLALVNVQLEALQQMLVDAYEEEDITSMRVPGATIRTQPEPYAQVVDKEAFREWCINNGLEDRLALPWMTTNAITKERLLAGEPEPTGVEAFNRTKVVITRDKE